MSITKEEKQEELLKLRESMGMNRRKFSEYFEIPYRTVQDWELGNREMPDYLLRLMIYKAKMDKKTYKGMLNCVNFMKRIKNK